MFIKFQEKNTHTNILNCHLIKFIKKIKEEIKLKKM